MTPSNPIIPYRYCKCGCGQTTALASKNFPKYGWIKDEPVYYVRGHNNRKETNPTIALSVDGKPAIGLVAPNGVIIIDPEDFHLVRNEYWNLDGPGYARAARDNKRKRMHRMFLPCKKGYEVDHKNQNKLDNRRANIREATRSQNMLNRTVSREHSSGVKGVHWNKPDSTWIVAIKVNAKYRYVGRSKDIDKAIEMRAKAEILYFGKRQ